MRRLAVAEYDHPAHWTAKTVEPSRVVLPLKQGAGVANTPLVRAGDRVRAGQTLGEIPAKALSAVIHAPFDATVAEVNERQIVLTR
jgi:Na+-translocating ferredoxin:NAD+ oxidoreductase RnfC subunit